MFNDQITLQQVLTQFSTLLKESPDRQATLIAIWSQFISSEPMPEDVEAEIKTFIQIVRAHEKLTPSQCDNDGSSALHVAAARGYDIYLATLCKKLGVDLNCQFNRNAGSPIHQAAIFNHVACLRVLVENGADINCVGNHGSTCLIDAANKGHAEIIEFLLAPDSKFTAFTALTNQGLTALQAAIWAKKPECILLLLPTMAKLRGSQGKSIVHSIVESNYLEALDLIGTSLTEMCMQKNSEGNTPLLSAINLTKTQMVVALIARGSYPDGEYQDSAPLLLAAKLYFSAPFNRQRKTCFDALFSHWKTLTSRAALSAEKINALAPKNPDKQQIDDFTAFQQTLIQTAQRSEKN